MNEINLAYVDSLSRLTILFMRSLFMVIVMTGDLKGKMFFHTYCCIKGGVISGILGNMSQLSKTFVSLCF